MRSFLFTTKLLIGFSILGCSTFRGPGPFHGPTRASDDAREYEMLAPEGPSIMMRGPRQTEITESSISFDWPVDEARFTRGFKAAKRSHWGIDLANHRGTKILAAERGFVVYTGNSFRGYGKLIVIEHGEKWATLYAHLDKILVKEGQTVHQGEWIGNMGKTGNARGVHLHFEIRENRLPVNPLAYLPQGFANASPR